MTTKNNKQSSNSDDFRKLLAKDDFKVPQICELVKGIVIAASKSEVKLDIGGILTGVVRGPELYEEDENYANLKLGDEVEATVIDIENENGDLELSFRYAGQEKAWIDLRSAYEKRGTIKVKAIDANKGGLIVRYRQISGFLPVSQLAPENYPRVSSGDKGKILEKLRHFINKEFVTKVMALEKDDKIIFSEKANWSEKQKDVISKYKIGDMVEGVITAITDFGVFINFDKNLEGLIHISELAWQRIDKPADLYKVGDKIKAEIINFKNAKIFLSAKKIIKDPWQEVSKKYKIGQEVKGVILKVNPFGLFVQLDQDIHGLAHISQMGLTPKQKINQVFKSGDKQKFIIASLEPGEHRLGLAVMSEIKKQKAETSVKSDKAHKIESKDKKATKDKQKNKKDDDEKKKVKSKK